jgi:hypothetical protein
LVYFLSSIFIPLYLSFLNKLQISIFIEKSLFGYEKPNDFGYLDFIPPAKIIIPSFLIYLFAMTLIYIHIKVSWQNKN